LREGVGWKRDIYKVNGAISITLLIYADDAPFPKKILNPFEPLVISLLNLQITSVAYHCKCSISLGEIPTVKERQI